MSSQQVLVKFKEMKFLLSRTPRTSKSAQEMDLEMEVRKLAYELGLSDEDLEMVSALGNAQMFSAEAMENRWHPEMKHQLALVA